MGNAYKIIKDLDFRISAQQEEITTLVDLIESKSHLNIPEIMKTWESEYTEHKSKYLLKHGSKCDLRISLYFTRDDFGFLFGKNPETVEMFYFEKKTDDDFLHRFQEIENFKQVLISKNPKLVHFDCWLDPKTIEGLTSSPYVQIKAYEFVGLEDYMANWFEGSKKELSFKKGVLTKLIKEKHRRNEFSKTAA